MKSLFFLISVQLGKAQKQDKSNRKKFDWNVYERVPLFSGNAMSKDSYLISTSVSINLYH